MNGERGNILIVVVGLALVLFVVGFFRSDAGFWGTVGYKKLMRLPCGVTVNHPEFTRGEKVSFPLIVDGYANGCGWEVQNLRAGTVQVFDTTGHPVTREYNLVVPADSKEAPYYFSANLVPNAAPRTDTGTILLRASGGLLHDIPVAF